MVKINPLIFREYDIRGFVGKELNDDFAYCLGRAFAQLIQESNLDNIGIGYDCRHSSKGFAHALARGISDMGSNATIIGMCPSPVLYYSIIKRNFGGGVQVTGSHNPSDMNGFKLSVGSHSLSGREIQDLRIKMEKIQNEDLPIRKKGKIQEENPIPQYVAEIIANSNPHLGNRKLKVVVDAGNGVGGMTGVSVLKGLGVETIDLFCDPDGDFPNHHPDPTVIKYLTHLTNTVRENKADFGVGWDGDADRIGIVDENGEVIYGDMLVLLYAREILKEKPGCTIIGDVKCSHRLFDDLTQHGANAIMSKTGHSLIKNKLKETGGELAGELSGHMFFKHRFFGFDDAIYATARFVELASNWEGPISQMLGDLPKTFSTPEIRLDCSEQNKFQIPVKIAESFSKQYPVITVDGARVKFPKGWGLVRASNTQSCLILRFEAEDPESLKDYQALVTEEINKLL